MERNDASRDVGRATMRLVSEAQQGMARAYDAPRVGVLRATDADGGRRPGEIGHALEMAASSVTRHVQALQDAGQVDVRADPADARTCLVEITGAGRDELRALEETGLAVFADVLAEWSDEDLNTLARLMGRLTDDWAHRGPGARHRTRPATTPRWRRPPDTAAPSTGEQP